MKKILALIAAVAFLVSMGLTSCSSAKPCPAYSKANTTEIRA